MEPWAVPARNHRVPVATFDYGEVQHRVYVHVHHEAKHRGSSGKPIESRIKVMISRTRFSLTFAICVYCLASLAVCAGAAVGHAGEDVQGLVDRVVSSIESNYALIHSVRAQIAERQLGQVHNDAPTEGELVVAPVESRNNAVNEITLAMLGEQLRFERHRTNERSDVLLFDGRRWKQYDHKSNMLFIRFPEQMPDILPLDPRDFALEKLGERVIDVLRKNGVLSAEMVDNTSSRGKIRIVTQDQNERKRTFIFDTEKGFLPTRAWSEWPDGSILESVEIEYQAVLEGRAFYPNILTRRVFAAGVTKSPEATKGWRQAMSWNVKELQINPVMEDGWLDLKTSEGTKIRDNTVPGYAK